MKELDTLFNKVIKKITKPELILEKYIKEEFNKINIALQKEQLDKIVKQLYPLTKDSVTLNIHITDEQLSIAGYQNEEESVKDIKKIFKNLTAGIEEKINKIISKFPEIMEGAANDSANLLIDNILSELEEYLAPGQYLNYELEESIEHFWGHSIDLLEALTAVSLEAGESFYKDNLKITSKNNCAYEVLLRLHAKACQTSSEVVTLLRSGYADGALARWRTLHEISIVSYFISEHGNDLAERYLDYQIVETYKAALQYQEYAQKLNLEKKTDDEMSALISEIKLLDEKYGIQYKKGGYGWAAKVLNKVKPTFRDIEESISLDHFRPYYKMASYNVHASAKGLYFKLGLSDTKSTMLAGPSNLGFSDPCRFTAISLSQITTNLLLYETTNANMDIIVATKVMMKLDRLIEKVVAEADVSIMSQ